MSSQIKSAIKRGLCLFAFVLAFVLDILIGGEQRSLTFELARRVWYGNDIILVSSITLCVLLIAGAALFIAAPFFSRKRDQGEVKNTGNGLTTISVIGSLLLLSFQTMAGDIVPASSVPVQTTRNPTTVISVVVNSASAVPNQAELNSIANAEFAKRGMTIVDGPQTPFVRLEVSASPTQEEMAHAVSKSLAEQGLPQPKDYQPMVVGVVGGILLGVVVVVLILGVVYVAYRIIKFIQRLPVRKVEDDDPTNSVAPRTLSGVAPDLVIAAAFVGVTTTMAEELQDSGSPNSVEVIVGANTAPRAYIPPNTIALEDYLAKLSLDTNLLTSFSVNGQPVKSLGDQSVTITFTNGNVTVSIPNTVTFGTNTYYAVQNITTLFHWSTNLVNWMDPVSVSVPIGTRLKFSRGSIRPAFERIQRQ